MIAMTPFVLALNIILTPLLIFGAILLLARGPKVKCPYCGRNRKRGYNTCRHCGH